jgi:Asp/Glu/hydantoin racemase
MRILDINPNTTVAMTEQIGRRRGGLGNRNHCRQSDGWTGLDRRLL